MFFLFEKNFTHYIHKIKIFYNCFFDNKKVSTEI